jgi:hypothetical protein
VLPTTQPSDSTGIDTTRSSLTADVVVEAAIGVELTLRLTVPPEDAQATARARALELVREEWGTLSLSFARALRDALQAQGGALRSMTVVATLADEDPQLVANDQVDDDART